MNPICVYRITTTLVMIKFDLPRGRTMNMLIFCVLRSDSENENMTTDEPIVGVAEPFAVVTSDMDHSCVDAMF